MPPLSVPYDSEDTVGDYVGLVFFWILGTNTGYGGDSFFGGDPSWQTNVMSPVNNGLSAWAAYRYSGNSEIYRTMDYGLRVWGGRPCGGTNIPCDKGQNICNVMMFDEANTSHDGVFPYSWPNFGLNDPRTVSNLDGPVASDLAALYIAAIFYDIAHESGLGLHKADLLIWKTISLITDNANFPMRAFGAKVQEAARALWPDSRPGRAGLSLYEEDILDVLTSRGIPMNGVSDFRTNLPPAIGDASTLTNSPQTGFASAHPTAQPSVNFYGNYTTFRNQYTDANTNAQYIAYQFYKYSKYGLCDKLALTDGTFIVNPNSPFDWTYNNDGTFYLELADRELGNMVVMLPGHIVRTMNSRQRCPNEATGFYAEDVRPFGYMVIKATPNGFSFTVTAITIVRTRGSQIDTLTLRERGNDLDRNSGQALVRNLIP